MEKAPRLRLALVCGLLIAAVFGAFWPALSAGFLTLDDDFTITRNEYFRGLDGERLKWMFTTFRMGHWQPLSWVTFGIDYTIWGLNPRGYHLTNLVLHSANAVFFFFLARAVLRAAGSPSAERIGPALFAALLFAAHPLRVESVAWVTERRDVLSTFFLLPALTIYFGWLREARLLSLRYAAVLALFALSLLSKAWAITLPAVLLVVDVWFGRLTIWPLSGKELTRCVLEKIPVAVVAAPAAVFAFLAQKDAGAMEYAVHFNPVQKLAQASFGLCYYILKSLWPTDLQPVHLLDKQLDPASPLFLASFAGVAAGIAIGFLLRRRVPAVTAALAVYAIVVSPVLGFTQSGLQLVADRYSYLSMMPFALLAGAAFGRIATPYLRRQAAVAAAAVVIVCGVLTFRYAIVWQNSIRFWEHSLALDPTNSFAWNQLGATLMNEGDNDRAAECFEEALVHDPESHLAFENRGLVRVNLGDREGALSDWDRAIELRPSCPRAWVNRGTVLFSQQQYAAARADYEEALRIRYDQAVVWLNLGSACSRLGDYAAARDALNTCLDQAATGSQVYEQALRQLAALPQ